MAPRWLVVLLLSTIVTLATGLKFDQGRDFKVPRNAPVGTVVGRLRVDGFTTLDGDIVYSLHNTSDHAYFHLNPQSGLLSTTRTMDREVNATYQIIARATNIKGKVTTEHGRFAIRVTAPTEPSDPARLVFDQDEYRGHVEPGSQVGLGVISTLALIVNSSNGSDGATIAYFIEPANISQLPTEEKEKKQNDLSDWFKVEEKTGRILLNKAFGTLPDFETRNFSFTVGAKSTFPSGRPTAGQQLLVVRAPATVTLYGIARPRDLTVAKLSANAAIVCWKFPVAFVTNEGTQGYRVRYWLDHHPTTTAGDDESTSSPQTAPLEVKITETDIIRTDASNQNQNGTHGDMRDICSHLKKLEPEAAYKVQVSAWHRKPGGITGRQSDPHSKEEESEGPFSAKLHFTTQTNLCLVNGTCETGECQISLEAPGYECLCHSGHYGRRCEHFDPCVLSPCLNSGTCVPTGQSSSELRGEVDNVTASGGFFRCLCNEGWAGDDCSVPDKCPSRPCLNNGTCSKEQKCICQPGYGGAQCQDFNPCWAEPCRHGATCSKSSSKDDSSEFVCICPPGYRGLDCGEAIDYCVLDPCRNDGRCSSRDGSYHCQCRPGFHGVDCEQDIDECISSPCRDGSSCLNQPGSYICICPRGLTGKNCQDEIDDCDLSPCQNRAVCENLQGPGNYTCHCRPGFKGRDCQINIDDCDPDPCFNGGICVDESNSFRCQCPVGFRGFRCDHKELCPTEEEVTANRGTFHWPETEFGQTVALDCISGTILFQTNRHQLGQNNDNKTYAFRSCNMESNGRIHWMESDVSNCKLQNLVEAENKSLELEECSKQDLTPILLDEFAEDVSNLVDFAVVDQQVAQNMFNSLSNVLDKVGQGALTESSESYDKILDAVDRFTDNVLLAPGQSLKLGTPNIALETVLLNTSASGNDFEGYSFQPSFSDPIAVSINLPKEALEGSSEDGGLVRLKFVSYRNGKLFQSSRNNGSKLVSDGLSSNLQPGVVLVASVGKRSVSGLTQPVTYSVPRETTSFFYSCVYWNEIEKVWSTSGIKTRWSPSSGTIECSSDHLTAFSVLLDPTPSERISDFHEYVLKLISYVGSGLSILGLSITVLLYSLFRNLRRDRGGKILLNLCISLLLLNIVFLMGAVLGSFHQEDADPNRVWVEGSENSKDRASKDISPAHVDVCTGLSLTLHYLILSSLSWMLVEAVHMYQLLITVFANSETCFMIKRIVAAWGLPMLFVIPTAVLSLDYYQDPSGQTCGRMSPQQPLIYYGAFIGPCCLILFINTVVFFLVLRVILMQGQRGRAVGKVPSVRHPQLTSECSSVSNGHNGTSNGISKAAGLIRPLVTMAQLRGAVTVMALLGVTWLAGALAIGPVKLVMTYLFCICNSLQGFVIFIVRVVQYPEARLSWITLWNTGQTHIPYDVTRHSTGPMTNSSGSNGQQAHSTVGGMMSNMSVKSKKHHNHRNSTKSALMIHRSSQKSPAMLTSTAMMGTQKDNSLTPSQAPTLPMSGDDQPNSSLTYQPWFPFSATGGNNRSLSANSTASPSSRSSTQSRFRRIFGQLGLIDGNSLRFSGKRSNPTDLQQPQQHSLLERHVSGATNPPSPGTIEKQLSILPEDLVKPNFLIGEKISLLQRNGSLPSLDVKEPWSSNIGRGEGANTSWTFLRPDFEEMSSTGPHQPYQSGMGSAPLLSLLHHQKTEHAERDYPHGITAARRTASFVLDRTGATILDGFSEDSSSSRRTLSLDYEKSDGRIIQPTSSSSLEPSLKE